MEKHLSCKCKAGCKTRHCRCFKNNKPCTTHCLCTNCSNPINKKKEKTEHVRAVARKDKERKAKRKINKTKVVKKSVPKAEKVRRTEYVLRLSGLVLSGHTLQKIDLLGNTVEKYDLTKIKEIVLRHERAYGCILVPMVFIFTGIFIGNFLNNRQIGLCVAVITSSIGMALVWKARTAYNYTLTLSDRQSESSFTMSDPKEEVKHFLRQLKKNVESDFCQITIRDLTEDG